MPGLDVVISTYNRHERLNRCLEALIQQTRKDFRVIVVDDSSDPPVAPGITQRCREHLDLTVIRTPNNFGPGGGRNRGVDHGSGELILFIDDDVDADCRLVERHLAAAEEAGPHAVIIGPLLAPPDWKPTPWNRWEARKLAVEYGRMKAGIYAPTWRQLFTGNTLLFRADFLAAGGFDEQFTRAEDIELGIRLERLGCNFVFEDHAIGWHYANRPLASWLNIPREYARFDSTIDSMYPELQWLQLVQSELRERHPLVRAARLLPQRVSTTVGIAAGRVMDRVHLYSGASAALSLVFDGEYRRSLNAALINRDRDGAGTKHAISTAG